MSKQMRQSRTRNEEPIPAMTTTEDLLGWIDKRIGLMQHLRAAVILVAGPERQAKPRQTQFQTKAKKAVPKARKTRSTTTARVGSLADLVLKTLHTGPLGLDEILQRLQKRGWQTSSSNPRSVLDATMRTLRERGHVQKVGQDWERTSSAPKTEEPIETPTHALGLDALAAE